MSTAAARSRRAYWRAVHYLREAETLADLGYVSGPADAPPASESEEQSWVEDWASRAKQALKKANEWLVEKPSDIARERARAVADRVRRGAAAVRNATQKAAGKIADITDIAQKIYLAGAAGSILLTVLLAYLAWKIWKG